MSATAIELCIAVVGLQEKEIKPPSQNEIALAETARAELAALRNDSKWVKEYHERLQNLRVMLNCSIADLPDRCAALLAQAARVTALETTVNEAQEIFSVLCVQGRTGKERHTAWDRADAWLAAHPSAAPEAGQGGEAG